MQFALWPSDTYYINVSMPEAPNKKPRPLFG